MFCDIKYIIKNKIEKIYDAVKVNKSEWNRNEILFISLRTTQKWPMKDV